MPPSDNMVATTKCNTSNSILLIIEIIVNYYV